jgi:hypothetical protein
VYSRWGIVLVAVALLSTGCTARNIPAAATAGSASSAPSASVSASDAVVGTWSATIPNNSAENGFPDRLAGTLSFSADGHAVLTETR